MAEPLKIEFPVPLASVCPVCAKNQTLKYQPFCSKRCADIDLHRWLSGAYAVASERDEEENDGFSTDVG